MVYTLTLEGQEEFDKSIKWNGEIGKINKDIILKYLSDDIANAVFYIYGPPGLFKCNEESFNYRIEHNKG